MAFLLTANKQRRRVTSVSSSATIGADLLPSAYQYWAFYGSLITSQTKTTEIIWLVVISLAVKLIMGVGGVAQDFQPPYWKKKKKTLTFQHRGAAVHGLECLSVKWAENVNRNMTTAVDHDWPLSWLADAFLSFSSFYKLSKQNLRSSSERRWFTPSSLVSYNTKGLR